jgi:RAD50-interacting protein 1
LDVSAIQRIFERHVGAAVTMRKLSAGVELLTLKDEGGDDFDDGMDAWGGDDENADGTPLKENRVSMKEVEEDLFENNEKAREVLERLGLGSLSESEGRSILERRVELGI